MPSIVSLPWGKKKQFIETLKQTGNVSAAARAIGVPRAKLYKKKKTDRKFSEEWQEALEEALDDLEEEVRRRALQGIEKPVYYGGKKCGSITAFNDTLAMFLLKARRPETFGEANENQESAEPLSNPREKLLSKLAEMKFQGRKNKK